MGESELRRPPFSEGAIIMVEDFLTEEEVQHMRGVTENSVAKESSNSRGGTSNAMVYSSIFRNNSHVAEMVKVRNRQGTPQFTLFEDQILTRVEDRIGRFLRMPANEYERALQLTVAIPS